MTDRELWVKTGKTVGAMVGATVVFLGSVSLILCFAGGRPASASSEAASNSATPAATTLPAGAKTPDPSLPVSPRIQKHGISASARPGESI
jgi:hypothetical protein